MSSNLTKKAIAEALKELLYVKPLSKITVNDVAEKCGINRQTFYYHFMDLRDLVEWICYQDADNAIANHKNFDNWEEGFLSIFDLMRKDRVFIMNIYHSISRDLIEDYLYRVVYDIIYQFIMEMAEGMTVTEDDIKFMANFYKYAFVGVLFEWTKNDMKDDPKKIVKRVSALTEGTIDNALYNASLHNNKK